MDLDYLQKQISSIDLRDQTIYSIAEYCILNSRGSQNEIGRIIDKSFPAYYSQKMLALLKLVSEIFIRTGTGDKRDNRFVKPLASKAKVYIQQISKRYKQIKPEHIKIVPEILNSWSRPGQEIFAFSFMQKLIKITEPITIASNRYQQQKRNNLFQNYSKTFLMEYEDIKSYEPTSRIYDDFTTFQKIAVQIGQINTQMKKLGLQHMTPQMVQRAAELRKKLQKFTDKLQDVICKYHVDFKILRQSCKQEFDKLPAEAKQVLNNTSQ